MEKEEKQLPGQENVETQSEVPVKERAQADTLNNSFSASDVQGIVNAAVEAALKQFQQSNQIPKTNEYQQTLIKHVANAQSSLITPSGLEEKTQKIDYVKKVIADDSLRRRISSDGKIKYGQTGEDFLKAKIILLKSTGDYTDEQIAEYLL